MYTPNVEEIERRADRAMKIAQLAKATTLDEIIALEEKNQLGSDQVGEFLLTKNARKNFFHLKNYTTLECLDILKLMQKNLEKVDAELQPAEALEAFLGLELRVANVLVGELDQVFEEKRKALADKIVKIIDAAVTIGAKLNNGDRKITTKNFDKTDQEVFTEQFKELDDMDNSL